MSVPTEPPKMPESSGRMTTQSRPSSNRAWPNSVYTIVLPSEKSRQDLRISRAKTDAKVCLIIGAGMSASIVLVSCALWLAHWITR